MSPEQPQSLLPRKSGALVYVIVVLRILLGTGLVLSSVQFILAQPTAMLLLERAALDFAPATIVIPILTLIQLVGGIMLIFGMLSRVAAGAQIPVLFLLLLGRDLRTGMPGLQFPLVVDILVLLLSIFFVINRIDALSIDRFLRTRQFRTIADAIDRFQRRKTEDTER